MLNEEKFHKIYTEYLESGLTIRDYCSNQGRNEAKFYYWQNKLKSQLPSKKRFILIVFGNGKQSHPSYFQVPTQAKSDAFSNSITRNETISCKISYPNGVCVKLNRLPCPITLNNCFIVGRTHSKFVLRRNIILLPM